MARLRTAGLSEHAARIAGSPRASPSEPSAAAHASRTTASVCDVVRSMRVSISLSLAGMRSPTHHAAISATKTSESSMH